MKKHFLGHHIASRNVTWCTTTVKNTKCVNEREREGMPHDNSRSCPFSWGSLTERSLLSNDNVHSDIYALCKTI